MAVCLQWCACGARQCAVSRVNVAWADPVRPPFPAQRSQHIQRAEPLEEESRFGNGACSMSFSVHKRRTHIQNANVEHENGTTTRNKGTKPQQRLAHNAMMHSGSLLRPLFSIRQQTSAPRYNSKRHRQQTV